MNCTTDPSEPSNKTLVLSPRDRQHLFESFLRGLQRDIYQTAVDKGWWDKPEWFEKLKTTLEASGNFNAVELLEIMKHFERNKGEAIALMHSELSEGLEALRHGNPPDDKVPKFSGLEAEFADTMIRIFDLAEHFGLDVIGAMFAKAEMNKNRPRMHGGKKF